MDIRVFASYSHDSSEHNQRVCDLVQRLRSEGIDAWLDQFVDSPQEGWPRWTERQLSQAHHVLVVCTENYKRRFDGTERGGANWEGLLTQQMLYDDGARNGRFIPILFGADRDVVPLVLRGATSYSIPAEYELLYRRLTRQQLQVPVPLGSLRGLPAPDERLDDRLLALQEQAKAIALAGEDTTAIRAQILDVRREIRDNQALIKGRLLASGEYELQVQLGAGGFGTVWQAWDHFRKRVVAIKILHAQFAKDRTRRERFFRGARLMSRGTNPGIVRIHDEHREDGPLCFYVMEYLPGGNLRTAVLEQKITPADTLSVLRQLAQTAGSAHAVGIVHRDIKPGNVMLTTSGDVRLTDFDLAWSLDTTGGTGTEALGSFPYSAPEQLGDAKEVDARADVYAIGMVGVFIAYGQDLPHAAVRDASAFIRDKLNCSSDLKRVLEIACSVEPQRRYATGKLFEDALRLLSLTSVNTNTNTNTNTDAASTRSATVASSVEASSGELTHEAATDLFDSFVQKANRATTLGANVLRFNDVAQEICDELVRLFLFDFSALHTRDQVGALVSVAGNGIAAKWTGLARHAISEEPRLRDIQADVLVKRRGVIVSGWDDRFDRYIYDNVSHSAITRVFVPLVVVKQGSVLVDDGHRHCRWKFDPQTGLEFELSNPLMAAEVIGTIEAGYRDEQPIEGDVAVRFADDATRLAPNLYRCTFDFVIESAALAIAAFAGADSASLWTLQHGQTKAFQGDAPSPRAGGLGALALSQARPLAVSANELRITDPAAYATGCRTKAAFPMQSQQGVLYLRFNRAKDLATGEIDRVAALLGIYEMALRSAGDAFTSIMLQRRSFALQSVLRALSDPPRLGVRDMSQFIATNLQYLMGADIVVITSATDKDLPTTAGRLLNPIKASEKLIQVDVDTAYYFTDSFRRLPITGSFIQREGIRSGAVVPLDPQGSRRRWMLALFRVGRDFSKDDMQLFEAATTMASLALQDPDNGDRATLLSRLSGDWANAFVSFRP